MQPLSLIKQGKVIPFGYAGSESSITRLERLVQRHPRVCIVDIRLIPQSRWHSSFKKAALVERFPKRYTHMPELGNLHYRPQDRAKGIKLANAERGIARLLGGLAKDYTIILLCACNSKKCHKWMVIALLEEALKNEQEKGQ